VYNNNHVKVHFKVTPIPESVGQYLSFDVYQHVRLTNPRITHLGVFCQFVGDLPDSDYTLCDEIPIRPLPSNVSDPTYLWKYDPSVLDSTGNPIYVVTHFDIDGKFVQKSLGTWAQQYDTDGQGYRPYNHTEADITRKMCLIEARKDRMYAAGVDGDEGQEMVARTPISNGYSQMDVWFKPLIAQVSEGKAINYMMEFQDRLLWFQRTGLVVATVGDTPRPAEYQFQSTGGGIGTHILRSIAKSNDAVFFCNYDGIFRYDNSKPIDITIEKIKSFWVFEVSKAQKDACVGGYNPKTNEYWLFIPDKQLNSNFDLEILHYNRGVSSPIWIGGTVWIWDDNRTPGQHWRTYTLDKKNNPTANYIPMIMFPDFDNNWVFIAAENNKWIPYFFAGENVDIVSKDPNRIPVYPITYEWETQNMGKRGSEIILNKIIITGEDRVEVPEDYERDPDNHKESLLTLTIYRNNLSGIEEKLIFTPDNRRPRKLNRVRCNMARFNMKGTYEGRKILTSSSSYTPPSMVGKLMYDPPELRELTIEALLDPKGRT
jgi:hypothetical protein